jgi:hypothetical protein
MTELTKLTQTDKGHCFLDKKGETMAKRLIDTELWNNEEIIENFTAEDKYFWLYLLTSPHNNICGVFRNSPSLIARDMGLHKDTIVNLIYRFEKVHNLIFADKDTNEVLILNWHKWNWTRSEDLIKTITKQINETKSAKIIDLLKERVFLVTKNKTVPRPSLDGTNTITNFNNINKEEINNKEDIKNYIEIDKYFDSIYGIYPRKVSKVQAKETFEHKLRGLDKEEAHKKAVAIYRMLEAQNVAWKSENDGQGRKLEHIPHCSSWLNANVEDSPNFKKGRRK